MTSLLRTEETERWHQSILQIRAVSDLGWLHQRGLAKKTDVIMDGRDIETIARMHLQRYILLQVLMRELREDMMNLRGKR